MKELTLLQDFESCCAVLTGRSPSFTLLDIKTFDAAGVTRVNAQHTDARRLAAHTSVASHCVNTEYAGL